MLHLLNYQNTKIGTIAQEIAKSLMQGHKLLIFGNGGSAADSQHLAAEFLKQGLPALALTTDSSTLTAIANDLHFRHVFERQLIALCYPGDCVLALSTSGRSENVLLGIIKAKKLGAQVFGITGQNGEDFAELCNFAVIIPSNRTERIQEATTLIYHIIFDLVRNAVPHLQD